MKNGFRRLLAVLLPSVMLFTGTGCGKTQVSQSVSDAASAGLSIVEEAKEEASKAADEIAEAGTTDSDEGSSEESYTVEAADQAESTAESSAESSNDVFSVDDIPAWDGSTQTVTVNDNIPFFTEDEKLCTDGFQTYADLDSLGRCGTAYACLDKSQMPTGERGEIGMIKPSGWQSVRYEFITTHYLYNRAHLIAWCLVGADENNWSEEMLRKDLITGTRALNEAMIPYETETADYLDHNTTNHVMYRVTPYFTGGNLVADGVLMEAWSVEDSGQGVCFCVWVYNEQPGVTINHADGTSSADDGSSPYGYGNTETEKAQQDSHSTESSTESETTQTNEAALNADADAWILNTSSMKIHIPTCSAAQKMSESNTLVSYESYDELIAEGYTPCGICHPETRQ